MFLKNCVGNVSEKVGSPRHVHFFLRGGPESAPDETLAFWTLVGNWRDEGSIAMLRGVDL